MHKIADLILCLGHEETKVTLLGRLIISLLSDHLNYFITLQVLNHRVFVVIEMPIQHE